jgi:hypothetical protein
MNASPAGGGMSNLAARFVRGQSTDALGSL